ncbi:hypothetical protein [Chromohalobacter sp. HP20-39]|uniref:hypothetical protein n=1 Tax=Chromohalobacter sp. HP20-39 TaxID=3079306 RepID=UPI00294B3103|nr:hypothetical protein [Chromohalobacter sp. HP20-39]MDV6318754.1 hypothetical protein [Chromohalobacter sp. HP20-39]
MSEREAGWYWVKTPDGEDCCARYDAERKKRGVKPWLFAGMSFDDDTWTEIGPRIPAPDEPWQCVPVEQTDRMYKLMYWHMVSCGGSLRDLWKEALAAAPKPGGE